MIREPKIKQVKDDVYIREKDMELISRLGGANLRNLIGEKQMRNASEKVENMGNEYVDEACLEVAALFAAYESFTLGQDKAAYSFHDFIDRVLNIKSMAGMFGYPLATTIAHSLYIFCEKSLFDDQRELDVIRLHIVMLERIFMDRVQDDGGELGREIVKQLRQVTSHL